MMNGALGGKSFKNASPSWNTYFRAGKIQPIAKENHYQALAAILANARPNSTVPDWCCLCLCNRCRCEMRLGGVACAGVGNG